jgi:hypothetical protein
MSKISSYLREITARIKGDEAGKVAAQNERKANSAIKGQLAALNAKIVDDENNVEDKQESYNNALYPTTKITDNQAYVRNLVYAKEALDGAKSSLESTKKSIAFFDALLKSEWDTLVEADSVQA